jgi:hypothetical protein
VNCRHLEYSIRAVCNRRVRTKSDSSRKVQVGGPYYVARTQPRGMPLCISRVDFSSGLRRRVHFREMGVIRQDERKAFVNTGRLPITKNLLLCRGPSAILAIGLPSGRIRHVELFVLEVDRRTRFLSPPSTSHGCRPKSYLEHSLPRRQSEAAIRILSLAARSGIVSVLTEFNG